MASRAITMLQRGYEAFNRGDIDLIVRELAAPDVEWGATGAFPGVDATYRGPEAIREWAKVILTEWDAFSVDLGEVLHEDDDAIVVAERLRGRGRGSGAGVEMIVFAAYWLDEQGRIRRRAAFTAPEPALAALREG